MITIAKIEKSDVMISHYQESEDPWGNRSRKLYQKIFKQAILKILHYLEPVKDGEGLLWYDIGAGGGNVFDAILENSKCSLGGLDISKEALEFLYSTYPCQCLDLWDVEDYSYDKDGPLGGLAYADIVSMVDVIYYWGKKRDYRKSLDELWKSIKVGAIVVVADSLIPYQMRSYYKSKSDCKLLEEFTDYTCPVNATPLDRGGGSHWNRYLKVKIYQKLPI